MMDESKSQNSKKELYGCIGIISAAFITGIFGVIIALPTLIPLFRPSPTPSSVIPASIVVESSPTATTFQNQEPANTTIPASPTQLPQIVANGFPVIQVGPFWGWRDKFSSTTLTLNILWVGDCKSNIDVVVDDEIYSASIITDTNDPLYLNPKMPFEGSTGTSCNYFVSEIKVVKPTRYFSVPLATYGVDLPQESPHEWCYQDSNKTWNPCK